MACAPEEAAYYTRTDLLPDESSQTFLFNLREVMKKSPSEIVHFILDCYDSDFLPVLKEKDSKEETIWLAITALGKACDEEVSPKYLNKLMVITSTQMNRIVINIQKHLVSLHKLEILEQHHLDALLYLSIFLKTFQFSLPSSASDTISLLLPLMIDTCEKLLKQHKDLHSAISGNIKLVAEEHERFMQHHSLYEVKRLSEKEKLHLLEPPENFRSLSILPTVDDVSLPCSFLRPNITKGRYKDTEHYLDVQFRLLREDFIKPLRDGVVEYIIAKKKKESLKKVRSVRVYANVTIRREEFIDGILMHEIHFGEKYFSQIDWKSSKRLLRDNLLCLSTDDFATMLFATVMNRDTEKLKKGSLLIRFEEMNEKVLSLNFSDNFVVIEVPALFESYRHNLKALQLLNEETLPMKNYIVNLENSNNEPCYLLSSTVYDMTPLLFPLTEDYIGRLSASLAGERSMSRYAKYKSVTVINDSDWPTASEINLDESQFLALKSAITKEFAIIQGPPGTGKTFIGLRAVQLLLHNIDSWLNDDPDTLPILVVCYTNHALDQFLEGISMLTKNIVRIGGRVSNENVIQFQIRNLKQNASIPYILKTRINRARTDIFTLKKAINNFSGCYENSNTVLSENSLMKVIPRAHIISLKERKSSQSNLKSTSKESIYDWLEINTFNNALLDKFDQNTFQNCDANDVNGDLEGEGEADIEYIENQRNIDYFDFNDRHVLRTNSESFSQTGELKEEILRKRAEYIRNSLQNNPTMTKKRALEVENVWFLPINERWQLYKFWHKEFVESKRLEYLRLQERLEIAIKQLADARTEEDLCVIQDAHVIGMTTTGAAKFRHIIEAKNPVVLIVEEAAEILESHIVASLMPKTQHVILIGDQQQLRPSPSVYMLAVKYGMDVSLFERMINNGIDYCRLSLQHRMRPEIAALIVPHIYTNLENHETVTKYDNIKGVVKNVFFVDHSFKELHMKDSKSKVNDHEAQFTVELCKYLILQGYDPSKITVLTTYLGQMFALKRLATDGELQKVRFTVVDNFQGEENDIILISFVRSNSKGEVGFLKVSNRICVALSRAKKGLYCIGNFTLLGEKSNLWRNIIETLNVNQSIGTSLRLVCQNHPDRFTDVAKGTDFKAVPEGGCGHKCKYLLSCGHSCKRYCHPDDADHKGFKCMEPCMSVCERTHACPRVCYEECQPCPIDVEKTLSKCGHTVTAWCGLTEDKIQCQEPCEKICDAGHQCPKQCYRFCGSCRVIVDKLLSRCNHTVKDECGKSEDSIKCQEACSKACAKGHACPKKCYEVCGLCETKVDKTLPKCGHTVNTLCCVLESRVVCKNKCAKSCSNGHACQKLCYEKCGSCNFIVDKTLDSCGHTVKAPCSKPEREIKCTLQCKRILPCSHDCKNVCYQPCTTKCLQLIEIQLPKCGHSLKVKCCYSKHLDDLHKKCKEPCKEILPCGHICNGTCGECRQGSQHVLCKDACQKILLCGHECVKKCSEPCTEQCRKITQVKSPVCGHLVKIECDSSNVSCKLSMKCLELCTAVLPCGHTCKGNCGSCYQGRLHVACNEVCNRILICGHKCTSKCCKSCPPCVKPCRIRCTHGKCPRKCGDPCVTCTKPCSWSCSHKKCSRMCYEVCDRDPCNERCPKQLPCNHQCIGFCGEPCPKECIVCDINVLKLNPLELKNRTVAGYVYLEDCKHSFKENILNKCFLSDSAKMERICMKSCPKCKTIICRNFRFNKIVKNDVQNIEKIKYITKWDVGKNLGIQQNLLQQVNLLHFNITILYEQGIKLLSGGNVRNIYELTGIENTLRIAKEIESKSYSMCSMFMSRPFLEYFINYMRYCREWMTDFISKNFLVVSEYQLHQLSREVLRLNLLDFLLKFAETHHFATLSPEFEKCSLSLMTFSPFTDKSVECFKKSITNFIKNIKDVPLTYNQPLNVISMSGSWYQCLEGHIICISKYDETVFTACYKCKESTKDNKSTMGSSNTGSRSKNNLVSDRDTSFKGSHRVKELDYTAHKAGNRASNAQSAATVNPTALAEENTADVSSRYPLSFMKYSNMYRQPNASHQSERERKSNFPNRKNKDFDSENDFARNNDRFRSYPRSSRSLNQVHSDADIAKQIPNAKRNYPSSRGFSTQRQPDNPSRSFSSRGDFPDNRRFRQASDSQQSYMKTNATFPRQPSVSESEDKRASGPSSRPGFRGRYAKGAEFRRQTEEHGDASIQSSPNVVLQQDSKKNAQTLQGGKQKEFFPKRFRGRGRGHRK